MALQSSGPISLNDVHKELGSASGVQCALGDSDFRTLAGVASGPIDLEDFYGASSGPGTLPFYFQMHPEYTNRNRGYLTAGAFSGVQAFPLYAGDTAEITVGQSGGSFTTSTQFVLGGTTVEVVEMSSRGFHGLGGSNWTFAVRAVTGNSVIPDSGWGHLDFWVSDSVTPPTGSPIWTLNRASPDTFGNQIGYDPSIIYPNYSGAPITAWNWPQAQLAQTYTGPLPPGTGFDTIFGDEYVQADNTKIWVRVRE